MRARVMPTTNRLLLLFALAAMALAIFGRANAQGVPPGPAGLFLNEPLNGEQAIAALGAKLDEVAAVNGRTGPVLASMLRTDPTLWVGTTGVVFYKEPVAPGVGGGTDFAPFPYGQTFTLHSKPGASKVIYLDFDGFAMPASTAWSGLGGVTISGYNTDGNAGSFSNGEQDVIQSVWQRVSEDYAAFDVDVTTQDPGDAAITRSGAGDTAFGTRALITNDAAAWSAACGSGCGGVAYVGTYDNSSSHAYYQPAFVFASGVPGAKNIAEATSHEVGHNLGLSHDGVLAQNGQAAQGYYTGCLPPSGSSCAGTWAPIMGVGYYKPISQWSKGDYSYANNAENDFTVIQANGLSYRADDHGDSTGAATSLGSSGTLSTTGIITTSTDVDYFSFTAGAGALSVTAATAPTSPNLDIKLELRNSAGTLITSNDPTAAMSSNDVATGMGASISYTLPSAGTYYLVVDGMGSGNAASGGYNDWASIGQYTITGTAPSGGGGGGGATKLGFTSVATSGSTAVALSPQPVVAIQDAGGATVTGHPATAVTLSKVSGPGTLTCNATTVNSVSGVATFAGCSLSAAGSYVLQATASGLTTAQTSTITISAPAANHLTFTSVSTTGAPGVALSIQPVLAVQNASNQTVTNLAATAVTLSKVSGPGTLSCTNTTVTTVNGVATFAGCSFSTAGTYVLQAAASGITTGQSANIVIGTAPTYHLGFVGGATSGSAGSALSPQPSFAIQNASNATMSWMDPVPVTLSKLSGPGTLTCNSTTVNTANAIATFAGCAFSEAGSYVLLATSSGIGDGQSTTITITAPVTNHLTFTNVSTTGAPGVALGTQPVVAIQDGSNQTVTGIAATAVTLTKLSGPGTLSCNATVVNSVSGVASFAGCSFSAAGTYVLQATASGISSGSSANIVITAPVVNHLTFTGVSTSGTTGVALGTQPVVAVQDPSNQTVTGLTPTAVTISKVSGPGTLSCTNLIVNTVSGVATFANCSFSAAGTYVLQATASGITTGQSGNIVITDPVVNHLTFTGVSTSGTTGVALGTQPVVAVQNPSNQTVTGLAPTPVTISKVSGPGTLSCTNLIVNTASGVATFVDCSFSAAGTYVLQATASGITTGQSGNIVITDPVANHLTFTGVSTSGTTGVALGTQPVVAVQDPSNQTVTGLPQTAVTISKVSGPGTLSCTNLVVNTASGVATFVNCSFSAAGTYVLQATASGITTGQSGNIVITDPVQSQLVFTSAPASGTTGVPFGVQPVVAVQDAASQTQTAISPTGVTLSKLTGPGTLTCTNLTVTTVNGVANFTGCSLSAAGTYTLQATASGITTAISGTITVTSPGGVNDKALIASPAQWSVLPAGTVTFTRTAGNNIIANALWIGSSPASMDLYANYMGGTSLQVAGLPSDGRTLYVRLFTQFSDQSYQLVDYVYVAAGGVPLQNQKATITSPSNGATMPGTTAAFVRTNATNGVLYAFWIGSTPGGYDIYSQYLTGTSFTVTNLPQDGRTLYGRLWTQFVDGSFQWQDYTYTASSGGGPANAKATVTSPAAGSVLGTTATFTRSAGVNVNVTALWVGTSVGGYDVFAGFLSTNSIEANGLPTGSVTLYVRLWTQFLDGSYQWQDLVYTSAP